MIKVNLLGTMAVEGAVALGASDLGGAKPRQLLALLALNLGESVPKDSLADRLWDHQPPARCITTLESYVCLLRRRLHLTAGRHSAIATSHGGYLLDPEHVEVDLDVVRTLLDGDYAAILEAVSRVRGELLADEPYADWAEEARTSFDTDMATACTRGAREANARRDHHAAARLAGQAVRRSGYCEPALRELMHALVGLGDRTAALRAYEDMRRTLATELGMDMDAESRGVFLRILQQDRAEGPGCDRAEASAILRLLRSALDTNPDVLAGMPGSPALVRALQALSPAV